jgi:hypothetical protein
VLISPVFRNTKGTASVHVQVEASDSSDRSGDRSGARVNIALAESAVVSDVLRGENSGRKLNHVAVVRSLTDLGSLDANGAFSADIPLTGELEHWAGKRIIAFVQNRQYGRIEGAAVERMDRRQIGR